MGLGKCHLGSGDNVCENLVAGDAVTSLRSWNEASMESLAGHGER